MPLFEGLENLHLLRPGWLLLVLPALAVCTVLLYRERSRINAWKVLIRPHLLSVLRTSSERASGTPAALFLLLIILISIALAGPSWRRQPSPFTEDASLLVIALDISQSMAAKDIAPSRLERARQKIIDITNHRSNGRTALVAFGATAHRVVPPTNDPMIVQNFLAALTTDTLPLPGKKPEAVLPVFGTIVSRSAYPATLLLITDGSGPETQTRYANFFSQNKHQLLILGVGREKESTASPDSLALERSALEQIARRANGEYITLSADKADVRTIIRQTGKHYQFSDELTAPWINDGYWLLFPIMLIFLLWFRRGWSISGRGGLLGLMGLVLGLVLVPVLTLTQPTQAKAEGFSFLDLWLTPDQQGRIHFEAEDYSKAATEFEDLRWRAAAHYKAGEFRQAELLFARLDDADGYFNYGNALAQQRKYLAALAAYKQTLLLEPGHAEAQTNRTIIQTLIEEIEDTTESQHKGLEPEGGRPSDKDIVEQTRQSDENQPEKTSTPGSMRQLSAEDIMRNEEVYEIWMRAVRHDPSGFLRAKFLQQKNEQGQD